MENNTKNKTILVVSATEGFLARSLVSRLEANKISAVLSNGNIKQIDKLRDQIELIILFMGDGMQGMAETLVYLKDLAADLDLHFVLIGEENEYQIISKILIGNHIYEWFQRPLVMDKLMNSIYKFKEEHTGDNRRRTVLIVDDDITYMRTVYEWLKDDYHVGMANNGVQAISYLARNHVDLVLLDYEMPIANGPQVLQMLKEDSATGQIPVMFLTGHSDRESVLSVVGLAPADYLLKTIDRFTLLRKLETFFSNRR